eukprot:425319-Amphidinium_carterae.1
MHYVGSSFWEAVTAAPASLQLDSVFIFWQLTATHNVQRASLAPAHTATSVTISEDCSCHCIGAVQDAFLGANAAFLRQMYSFLTMQKEHEKMRI